MAPKFIGGVLALGLAAVLAGCGSTTAAAPASSTSTAAKSSAPAASGPPTAPVKTATISVGGKSETVLTTRSGYTLYYFTSDTPTTSNCTGSCATLWPPLLTSATSLASPSGIPGHFSVVQDANGSQVEYQGHLLYRYSGDKAPGQANGQGLYGKWWVATPGLTAASTTAASSSSSSGSGW